MRSLQNSVLVKLLLAGALIGAVGCRTNETPEQQVRDAKIAANVKSKLVTDIGPSSVTNISVNVTNGIVTLAGTVDDSNQKSKAVAVAQALPEVARVNDDLQVTAGRAP